MTQLDHKKLTGVISALPTPFLNGEVDYQSLEKLVRYQLKNGINGFVINGTTAESPTLQPEEVEKIFKTVKEIVEDKIPLILGTGSNSTFDTIADTIRAKKLGAAAALVVVPYYNKPPQRGLEQHFASVAETANFPILLYNVPGRTITSLASETIQKLAQKKNIIGIKEATGDIAFDEKIKSVVPKEFIFLSGDDPTYLPFLKLGGHGIISVMSNLLTAACAKWTELVRQNQFSEAETDFNKYKELIQLMYVEANPIPLKWMLYKAGLFRSAEMRLPLVSLDEKFHLEIEKHMKKLGLL